MVRFYLQIYTAASAQGRYQGMVFIANISMMLGKPLQVLVLFIFFYDLVMKKV